MVRAFYVFTTPLVVLSVALAIVYPPSWWTTLIVVPVFALGVHDSLQRRHAVLRNFPILGHFRYLLELIRPEINQYFIESETDGTPYPRDMRSLAYQRAKNVLQTVPFGTMRDVYEPGYEWLNHSLAARSSAGEHDRIRIGGPRCTQPYESSLLNVSAMSFGALSANAIRALSAGARQGGFALNTGEGSVSPHHLSGDCDLIWQIGTGYFGCRTEDGGFDRERFATTARLPQVKMIEVKLSQGAKPGHGGILPAEKITPEISEIRAVPMGRDVVSPPSHTAFGTPRELVEFLDELRELSGGKPVGFKLCVGNPPEFLAIVKAMHETGLTPDFIVIDGGEGGTGAAPVEFTNSIGAPLTEALVFVHNALTGFGLRDEIKLIASGKILTAFHMVQRLAAGADLCNAARGFMFSLGCIQARRCNSNDCPVGVATQNAALARGLVPEDKAPRVASFHRETIHALAEILGAAGLEHADDLRPWHIHRRISRTQIATYAEIFDFLEPGSLLADELPEDWGRLVALASPDSFVPGRTKLRMVG